MKGRPWVEPVVKGWWEMPKTDRGTVWFDRGRMSWRVRVYIDGQPIYRRAKTHPEALQIRQALLMQKDRAAYERLMAGETVLDVSGLTDEQIATLLMLIESWGYPEVAEVPMEIAEGRHKGMSRRGQGRLDGVPAVPVEGGEDV